MHTNTKMVGVNGEPRARTKVDPFGLEEAVLGMDIPTANPTHVPSMDDKQGGGRDTTSWCERGRKAIGAVAGPSYMWWLYLAALVIVHVGTLVFIVIALIQFVDGKVTEVSIEQMKVMPYPDIYVCIPARVFYHTFLCCKDGCKVGDTGCPKFARLAPALVNSTGGCQALGEFESFNMVNGAVKCPYAVYVGAAAVNAPVSVAFQRSAGTDWEIDTDGVHPALEEHEYPTRLENMLDLYTPDSASSGTTADSAWADSAWAGTPIKARCYYYQGKGEVEAASILGEHNYLMSGFISHFSNYNLVATTYYTARMLQQGVPPYFVDENGKDVDTAAEHILPGCGSKSSVSIKMSRFKDETVGYKEYLNWYAATVIGVPLSLLPILPTDYTFAQPAWDGTNSFEPNTITHYAGDESRVMQCINAFAVSPDHMVESILVRRQTYAELLSTIGGLYAVAMMVLNWMFVYSGATNRVWQQVKILNCLGDETRSDYLHDYNHYDKHTTMQAQLDQMEAKLISRMQALEAHLGVDPMRQSSDLILLSREERKLN